MVAQYNSAPIFNGFAPKEGPKGMTVPFNFSVAPARLEVELFIENSTGQLQFVQSVYVDNSTNPNPLTLLVPYTQQRVVVPATAQGIWPLFAIDQTKLVLTSVVNAQAIGNIILLNVPMPLTQWGPNNVAITATVDSQMTSTNRNIFNGVITVPGTAEIVFSSNALRKGISLYAPVSNLGPLYVSLSAVFGATDSGSGFALAPGEKWLYTDPPLVNTAALYWNATGATTRLKAWEWT